MARNYYSEIHLHLVWHTKSSLPLLIGAVEVETHRAIRRKIVQFPGAFVHEIGGTDNHVHLAVTIVPMIPISEFIGQLKGASAHEVNQKLGERQKVLEWQSGYGVVSFGTNNLEWVRRYIRNQREHHARGTVIDRLERIADEEKTAQAEHREAP